MTYPAREVLSAHGTPGQLRTLNEVILAVAVLSAVGAGWIMLSFAMFKQVRTFRHQLILGLAISDFLMAINFLSSSALNLHKHSTLEKTPQKFCSFNGFMIQLFVVSTDYWVLLIAISTFLILANYKHQSSWIQEHRIVLWVVPWFFATLWAAIGLAVAGYGDIGAWCWFTSDKVRLLVNFLPRWLIILAILGLYARLYTLIYRAHTRFQTFDNTHSHSLNPETESVSSTRRMGRPVSNMQLGGLGSGSSSNKTGGHRDKDVELSGSGGRGDARGGRKPTPVLKKMAYQMMSYPIVYMLIWTIPTAIRIYQATTGKPAPFAIATVDKACIVIQGFADSIIYGVNETSLGVWRDKFSKQPPTKTLGPNSDITVTVDVNVQSVQRREAWDLDELSLESSGEGGSQTKINEIGLAS